MKKIIYPFLTLALIVPLTSNAIVYYQSKGGAITKIDEAAFKNCSDKVIYRSSGKDELPQEQKKKLLVASLRGDVINDPQAASTALKAKDGSCSYSENDDLK